MTKSVLSLQHPVEKWQSVPSSCWLTCCITIDGRWNIRKNQKRLLIRRYINRCCKYTDLLAVTNPRANQWHLGQKFFGYCETRSMSCKPGNSSIKVCFKRIEWLIVCSSCRNQRERSRVYTRDSWKWVLFKSSKEDGLWTIIGKHNVLYDSSCGITRTYK